MTAIRDALEAVRSDSAGAQKLLRAHLEGQLHSLDTKEENLPDLASNGSLPNGKIGTRLAAIARQREKLKTELASVVDDLSDGIEHLERNMRLLEDPHALYLGSSEDTRRKLNQAIFKHIFVVNEEVAGDEINSPLVERLAAQRGHQSRQEGMSQADAIGQAVAELHRHTAETKKATPRVTFWP